MVATDTHTRTTPRAHITDALSAAARWAVLVHAALPRPLRWLTDDPRRMLTLAWMVGLILAGCTRAALADQIIVGPDLAHGGPKTLFETYDFLSYKLTVKPDDESSGWFDLGAALLQVVGFLNNLILWASLGTLYGALTLLQWFLNLTIYRDSAPQIDTATQMIANNIFWPLIAATVAVGAFLAYARWRGEGRGFLSDLGWVIAAGAIAAGFAAGPSHLMNEVDSVRQDMAAGIISGASQFVATTENPAGFPTPALGGDPQDVGSRTLVDGVWSTYGVTLWCLSEFHDLAICKVAGTHALADDDQWEQWMLALGLQGAPPEFGNQGDWIRGQDITRTGYLLLLALLTIPMGVMLLRLVISGLISVVGLLLMLIIGLLFLTTWPIPGWFRQTGTKYWVYTLGLELQGLFITVIVAGDMVVVTIISTQLAKFGVFVVAVLDLAVMAAAMKARAWLELLTTTGGGGSMGIGTFLLARAALRTVATAGGSALSGAARTGRATAGFLNNRGQGPGWGRQPGATTTRFDMRSRKEPRTSGMSPLHPHPIMAHSRRLGPEAAHLAGAAPPPALAPAPRSHRADAPMPPRDDRILDAGPSSPKVVDAGLPANVAKAQRNIRRKNRPRGRVWIDTPGSGLSPLTQPNPVGRKPVRPRDGAYRITGVRPPRKPRGTS
jgi:hypothetical protein